VDVVVERLDVRAREPGDQNEVVGDLDLLGDVVNTDVDALLAIRDVGDRGRQLFGFDGLCSVSVMANEARWWRNQARSRPARARGCLPLRCSPDRILAQLARFGVNTCGRISARRLDPGLASGALARILIPA
jgi:hypothetical protein